MLFNISLPLIRTFPCTMNRFTLCCVQYMSSNAREARMFNKLLSSTKKKRKLYICETPFPYGRAPNLGKHYRSSKENSRRVAVLNKLFLQHISDLLETGSFTEPVRDKGLEITKVSITLDFKQLNVFWTSNNEKHLDTLEAILPSLGFTLRHELTQLRVIGIVPRILFVKDKQLADALRVDSLLKIVDFGDDHEPCHMESDFKVIQNSHVNISRTQKNDVQNDEECGDQQDAVELMPVMRHDTFNLEHDRIMKKIMKSMHKTRALHRFDPNLVITGEGTNSLDTPEMTTDHMTKLERKNALAKFILQRKLQKERGNRDKYNCQLNVPVYQLNDVEEVIENEELNIEDFIDEDDDDNNLENEKYNY